MRRAIFLLWMAVRPLAASSEYYRGHYGASGWGDSVNEKSYSNNALVFTGSITENQTK